ncbi:carboxypeptidase-like regulatory domain-containing protein [Isachenkonia alkalipeptolytica]|uniref:Carboxypeptidase regulatory-like domain-containing protein n=1 Tax=Isachenkonia alkalipeptolytica TaxID=2565777 RepID=A0AA43XMN9_9CLOT|nr:carboxypeptidase-like regulatory domain-containing protein [Isachenkonia alkalipeptolytica]NBG89049.1 carboxypeptidase regulatory-like domain-containing protein [Isachenkonia alkalipeptolytica]
MKSKKMLRGKRLLILTLVFFLSFTLFSGAMEAEGPRGESRGEEGSYLVMERVTDWFSMDNFEVIENAMDRIEEITDSIGRGTERIGESIDKITDFIGFGDNNSGEESGEEEGINEEQDKKDTGEVRGTFTTKDGDGVEDIRVNLGNYATYTNSTGDFAFDEIPYGIYTLSYQASESGELKPVEEILLDGENNRYVINLVIEQEPSEAGEAQEEEIIVDAVSEEAPEESPEADPEEDRGVLGLLLILSLLLLAIVLIFVLNRKHIKIIDAKTGESLGKRKVDIKAVTWIDLTEEFQEAAEEKIRIRFIRSALKKLYGKKVIFTVGDQVIAEIPEYTGELDFLIRRKPLEEANSYEEASEDFRE